MRSFQHRVDDELHIFGVDSKKILRRFKEDFHVRCPGLLFQTLNLNIDNHEKFYETFFKYINLI